MWHAIHSHDISFAFVISVDTNIGVITDRTNATSGRSQLYSEKGLVLDQIVHFPAKLVRQLLFEKVSSPETAKGNYTIAPSAFDCPF